MSDLKLTNCTTEEMYLFINNKITGKKNIVDAISKKYKDAVYFEWFNKNEIQSIVNLCIVNTVARGEFDILMKEASQTILKLSNEIKEIRNSLDVRDNVIQLDFSSVIEMKKNSKEYYQQLLKIEERKGCINKFDLDNIKTSKKNPEAIKKTECLTQMKELIETVIRDFNNDTVSENYDLTCFSNWEENYAIKSLNHLSSYCIGSIWHQITKHYNKYKNMTEDYHSGAKILELNAFVHNDPTKSKGRTGMDNLTSSDILGSDNDLDSMREVNSRIHFDEKIKQLSKVLTDIELSIFQGLYYEELEPSVLCQRLGLSEIKLGRIKSGIKQKMQQLEFFYEVA